MAVIILQCISVSNQHAVHLKLMQRLHQLYIDKAGKKKIKADKRGKICGKKIKTSWYLESDKDIIYSYLSIYLSIYIHTHILDGQGQ